MRTVFCNDERSDRHLTVMVEQFKGCYFVKLGKQELAEDKITHQVG